MSYYGRWKPYVPVAQRRANAERQIRKLDKTGRFEPVRIEGRTIAHSFWGKGWCTHLEKHSDFDNRLPRGRSYVRNGAVCHLEVKAGRIEARVSGSDLYSVAIDIGVLKPAAWSVLKGRCSGEIGSLLELLQGRLSSRVMSIVTDRDTGLFPKPGEMKFTCSCPDWADMCKHVAAVLYGVGHRLDGQPAMLFQLRGVDASELVAASLSAPAKPAVAAPNRLADEALSGIFGIELDDGVSPTSAETITNLAPQRPRRQPASASKKLKSASRGKPKGSNFEPSGKSIARLRKQSGLSISEFARQLSVSAASVSRWEAERGSLKLQARCMAALQKLHLKLK